MNAPTPFFFDNFAVRVDLRDGAPWFVLADVCRALEIGNSRDAAGRLDEDEKMTVDNTDGHSGQRGGAQSFTVINESGLYSLILTSRKPAAKRFKKWVTSEVLPSIRRTGAYAVPPPPPPEDDGVQVGGWRELELTAGREDARRRDLEMVAEARRIFGRGAARALWAASALPWPGDEGGGLDPDSERLPADLEQALAFLAAATVAEPAGRVQASKLYAAYRRWCGGRREETVNENRFGRLMTACRVSRSKIGGLNVYLGRRLAGGGI